MKNFISLAWTGAIAAIGFGMLITCSSARAESVDNGVVDLKGLTCRNLLEADGDGRSDLLVFMHGYISGKSGELMIDGPALAAVTEEIIDACIDRPDRTLMDVFEEKR